MNIHLKLTYTQARRAATSLAARVHDMDEGRMERWWEMPAYDPMTEADQRYRAELLDAYDAISRQIDGRDA